MIINHMHPFEAVSETDTTISQYDFTNFLTKLYFIIPRDVFLGAAHSYTEWITEIHSVYA